MKLETLAWSTRTGWSAPLPSSLDGAETLVLLFGASELADAPEPIRELRRALPRSRLVGCSTSGEICGAKVGDGGISLAVVRFEGTPLAVAGAEVTSAGDSFDAGARIARELERPDLRAVFLLSDGLRVNGSELVRGVNSVLKESVVVTGGLAGDGDRFRRTWVLEEGNPRDGFVCGAGFYGDRIEVGHGSKGGWDRFGPERVVSRSKGNVLFELDGKPALDLYKTYLGERAAGLPATALLFPLALRAHAREEKSLVRTILAVDERARSLTFAGDVPEGALAQLMRANFDRLVDGAEGAASMTRRRCADGRSTLAVAISCVGRRLVLGERTEEELEAVGEVLPTGARVVGFYSYGEISPFASGACDLHNQTMTLTTLQER
ncbi:MAG TPA: FIST N-terminal domain-containing protein [Planctomycetota bacterium]|jgi:hypothetical protein|nr:FIST N-terminal domain-containing protein [Planctomycetota bacterium]